MGYYLVITSKYFYDGHGTSDLGGTKLNLSIESIYDVLDSSKSYYKNFDDDLIEEVNGFDKDWYSEDGYNKTRNSINFKVITEEQYTE